MTARSESELVIFRTRAWLEAAVIGLNLCPFAKAVHGKGRIRWAMSEAHDEQRLLQALEHELETLRASPIDAIETTLLIHPHVLRDFYAYNDFLGEAEALLSRMGCTGLLQLASFHPQYVFAGTGFDDISNATNRSPYPMLHLLREESVDRAVAAYPDANQIVERNLAAMEKLGHAGWLRLARAWLSDEGL